MRYWIEARGDHLYAALAGRETAAEMREFALAVHAACRSHDCSRILVSVRASRPVFKPEEYGISGYASALVGPACQIALLGDSVELNAAHEYIEVCARQQKMNVRAFRNELAALRWLRAAAGQPEPRKYRFARTVVQGAPDEPGVYALWEGDELVYYGRAPRLREALLARLASHPAATHYGWELCADPARREAELLRAFEREHGRMPRDNAA
ncbi:MAG TPA: hypothetical protein VF211_11805 [Burkholderiales bacterium]